MIYIRSPPTTNGASARPRASTDRDALQFPEWLNAWSTELAVFSQITIPSFWCDCACEHTIFVAFTFYTATANVRYSAYSRYRVILSSITSNKLNFTRLVYYSFSPRPLRCDCELVSGYSLFSSVNSVYVPQYLTTRHYLTVVISGFARVEDDLVV